MGDGEKNQQHWRGQPGLEKKGTARRSVYVPLKRRAARFVEALAQTGNVTMARETAGLGKDRVYGHRKENAEFAAAWEAALAAFRARIEAAEESGELGSVEEAGLVLRPGRGGRLQLVSPRPDQWTKKKEEIFLAHFAASANVTAASRAAGFTSKTAWERRRTNADFERRFEEAKAAALDAIELMLMEEGAKLLAAGEGERPDPQLAMWLLKRRDQAAAGGLKRGGRYGPRRPTIEEVTEKITRKVGAIKRHKEAQQIAAGWTRDEEGNMIPPGWVKACHPHGASIEA
jgi:hypothetical protein